MGKSIIGNGDDDGKSSTENMIFLSNTIFEALQKHFIFVQRRQPQTVQHSVDLSAGLFIQLCSSISVSRCRFCYSINDFFLLIFRVDISKWFSFFYETNLFNFVLKFPWSRSNTEMVMVSEWMKRNGNKITMTLCYRNEFHENEKLFASFASMKETKQMVVVRK